MTPAKGYMEMKDSGIEWIEAIPAHWDILRGKNVLRLLERPVKPEDDVVTCFRDGEVTLRKNRREEGFTNSLKEIGYQGIEPGDLIVHGMDGFAGAIGISDSRGKASPVLNVMDSNQNKRYLMYYLRAMAYKDVFMALSTGIRVRSCDLRWNKLSVFPFLIPKSHEQSAIAAYLDTQCAKIDEIIAQAKASIEDYKQWKASIIYEAVTKGLDPNVEMKDSGITWIGKIPAHWDYQKVFRCFNVIGSGTTPKSLDDDYYSGEIPWLQSGDINGWYVEETSKHITTEALNTFSALKIYEAPFIAVAMYGASIANTSIVSLDACTNQACCVLSEPAEKIEFEYIFYAILASKEELLLSARGGTQPNISQEIIRQLKLPIPPPKEQQRIITYLHKKVTEIDHLIGEKQSLIDDLESYKKSLIYEVVTGKRRVC